ncbi:hypothetical protein LshimejAT787_1500670 [Lyophyllum shimeji]|uniref:Uncharacterized protein n=1 Tax=Lyophyllum shimeji TaxID=47721 RepID=A0A9P3USR4_LYOSH|nr:hypothetical protein LshimejAT787_1500670 [Lyophyllum shimeji]
MARINARAAGVYMPRCANWNDFGRDRALSIAFLSLSGARRDFSFSARLAFRTRSRVVVSFLVCCLQLSPDLHKRRLCRRCTLLKWPHCTRQPLVLPALIPESCRICIGPALILVGAPLLNISVPLRSLQCLLCSIELPSQRATSLRRRRRGPFR